MKSLRYRVARPYAAAIFSQALELKCLNEFEVLLLNLSRALSHQDLKKALGSPCDSSENKLNLVADILEVKDNTHMVACLRVLIDSKRLECIDEIANEYSRLLLELNNSLEVEIKSAFELSLKTKEKVESALKSIYIDSKHINACYVIDDRVLGGMEIIVGNKVIDISLRDLLKKLEVSI
jgi:F-type H+-transporting ATPase subunit delta